MEIKDMTMEDIEKRSAEIEELIKGGEYDAEALDAEIDALALRKAEIRKEAEERKAQIEEVLRTSTTVRDFEEEKKMENKEIRNSKEYIEAFANYIKSNDDSECRALLTENVANGTVPVPEFVYNIVKTAWDEEGLMKYVKKEYLKGNLKIGFEASADDAVVHTEGSDAINPENLIHGIVTLIPKSIKKVVQISDEAYDMGGEDFLKYIYREIAHKIAKKMADELLADILAHGTVSTTTSVGVPALASAPDLLVTAKAIARLSDEANQPIIVMNKLTSEEFEAARTTANYMVDPYRGLPVVFNNTLPAYAAASTGAAWAIVGDFSNGALANFPNGEEIRFKFDDLSMKKSDMIEVLGREYVALGIIAPDHFVTIEKN